MTNFTDILPNFVVVVAESRPQHEVKAQNRSHQMSFKTLPSVIQFLIIVL